MKLWQKFCAWASYVWKRVTDASADAERFALEEQKKWFFIPLANMFARKKPSIEANDYEQRDARRAHFKDYLYDQTGIDQHR